MAENEKRYTLVEGTPDEHADAIQKSYKRGNQMEFNRGWLFIALVLFWAIGFGVYNFVYPLLYPGP